ncbi:hypothetical protein PRR79_28500, partial [Klebsiella pneumoniae]|nr:hypothetical protein [Klebsiella pneumoniae]
MEKSASALTGTGSPEMQVADVGHFSGPLAAAPALLVQFRIHRLVSGRKMTVKQQKCQQPRQKDA